jgi:predicted DNA-binding mobile mystery protein A
MQIHNSIVRRQLDRRLDGVADTVGSCPPDGWAKTIRRALGMSTGELGQRLAVSQSRASQLERGEVDGSIRLSALRRVAAALNCRLVYAFVPNESLEGMVRRQARRKVAEQIALQPPTVPPAEQEFVDELLDSLALERVDSQGLWRLHDAPSPGPGPTRPDG